MMQLLNASVRQHFSVSPSARLYYVTMDVVPCNLQIKMLCKRRITAFGCHLNSKASKTYCGTEMRLTPENPHAPCHSLYACEWSMVIQEVLKLSILLSHFRPQESQNICTTSDKVSTAQSYERTQNSANPGAKGERTQPESKKCRRRRGRRPPRNDNAGGGGRPTADDRRPTTVEAVEAVMAVQQHVVAPELLW